MRIDDDNHGVSLERLENVLQVVARYIVAYGFEVGYLLDRLEAAVETASKDDPVERAKRLLERGSRR